MLINNLQLRVSITSRYIQYVPYGNYLRVISRCMHNMLYAFINVSFIGT